MKPYRSDPIKSDLARIDRTKDSDIDDSDIPELGDEFFAKASATTGDDIPTPHLWGGGVGYRTVAANGGRALRNWTAR
jgi:hypothetical protein